MPKLVQLYIVHSAIGFAISAVFVAGLLILNVANLWHLVSNSSVGVMAVALLWLFNGIVFSGVQFGIALTRMARPEGGNPGSRVAAAPPIPLAVRAD